MTAQGDMRRRKNCTEKFTIITRHPERDVIQLVKHLSEISVFDNGSLCYYISPDDEEVLKYCADNVDKSSIIILYHSHSSETPLPDMSDMVEFLDYCRGKHGPENIKVVINNVEDINLERKITEGWMVGRYWEWELLTFSKAEMKSLIEHKINPLSAERRMASKLQHFHQILQEAAEKNPEPKLQDSDISPPTSAEGQADAAIRGSTSPGDLGEESHEAQDQERTQWDLCPDSDISPPTLRVKLGIFSRSTNSNYSWITELLQSDHFKDCVSDVEPFAISNDPINTEECSFGILYFTKKEGQISGIDATEVQLIQQYRRCLGKDDVIIVMDDVENSSDQEKIRILESHRDIEDLYHNFLLFSLQEKQSEYKNFFSSLMNINKSVQQQPDNAKVAEGPAENADVVKNSGGSKTDKKAGDAAGNINVEDTDSRPEIEENLEASFKENMDKVRKIIDSTRPSRISKFFGQGHHTVGIFSRSSESDYKWLIKELKSELFLNIVSTVGLYYISNNGMWQFRENVSQCTFGILYHTKNRGRINIVDVTDSLYDEELKYMSEHLGREKVIVVVDDLEDTTEKEKTRILKSQNSIGNLAKDIFLFNAVDKTKNDDN